MDGMFSGKGERLDDPMGGRTRLYKEGDYTPTILDIYQNRVPEMFDLRYPQVQENRKDGMTERIREFLLVCVGKTEDGASYKFGESLAFFEQIGMMPPIIELNIGKLRGSYLTFRLARDGKTIIANAMRIFNRGYVEVRSVEDPTILLLGRAYLMDSILHILFFKKYIPPNDVFKHGYLEPFYAYYTYKLGSSVSRSRIKHAFGISNHVTVESHIRCGAELLVPLAENEEGKAYEKQASFKIDTVRCSAVEKENWLQQYPVLSEFFEPYKKNVKVEDRSINAQNRSFAYNEDGNTYFAAACYEAYQKNIEATFRYLHDAKIAGFCNLALLEIELTTGLLRQISAADKQGIRAIFGI
jgi:hypothetical protein